MKTLVFNNHVTGPKDVNKFAREVFDAILQDREGMIKLAIDDGDGDVTLYNIIVLSEHNPAIQVIKEN